MNIEGSAPHRRGFTPGIAHHVVTIVLLGVCLGVVWVAPLVVGVAATEAMDAGAGRGGLGRSAGSVVVPLLAGNALFVVVAVIAIWRLTTSRPAINVVVTGCVLEVMLVLITMMLIG